MTLTTLTPLDRTASTFRDDCDTFFGTDLPRFVTEVNAFETGIVAATQGGGFTIGYTFSTTTTDSDPGAGHLRLSNATQNAATTIRADLTDVGGTTWTSVLDTFDDSTSTVKGQIRLTKLTDGSKWLAFNVTAIATPSGYRNITVSNVGSSAASPFVDGDYILLAFTRTGDKGDQGASGTDAATAIQYTFDTTTTDSDPGSGKLRLSSATQNTSTVIRTDLLDINGSDMTSLLDTFDGSTNTTKGQIRLSKLGDPTKFLIFNLTSRAAPSGYRNLTVSVVASSAANPFSNADTLVLSFVRTGDAGAAAAGIEIGSLVAMNQSADVVTIGSTDYQRSGVLAASGYTSAPLVALYSDRDNPMAASGSWSGCAFGNGIAIAVSSASATGARSLDNGLTWQSITLPGAATAIDFGGGQFIATSAGSANVYNSVDGVTWATNALPSVALGPIAYGVIGGNGIWVAVNSSGTAAASSVDGVTWTARTLPVSITCRNVRFGNSTFFATDASLNNNAGCSSTNGTSWNARSSPVNRTWSSCVYLAAAGLWVLSNVSSNTDYLTSADAITWTGRTWPTTGARYQMSAGWNLFAAFTGTTTYHVSADGISWTSKTLTGAATNNSTQLATLAANGDGGYIYPVGGSVTCKTINAASGRGHQRALFGNPVERTLPMYMRMN